MHFYYRYILPLGLIFATACGNNHSSGHHHSLDEEEAHELHDEDSHNHHDGEESDEIVLSPEAAEKFGVKTAVIKGAPFSQAIKVSGVIENSPGEEAAIVAKSSGAVNFNANAIPGREITAGMSIGTISSKGFTGGDADEVASLQLKAAQKELERITPLYKEGIVSEKEFNAVKAAYDQASATSSGRKSGSVLVSPIAGAITGLLVAQGQYVATGEPVATVARNTKLILRADLPQRYYSSLSGIKDANIKLASADTVISISKANGHRISTSTNAGAQNGYIPVYFTMDRLPGIIPGSNAEVYLLTEARDSVVTLPVNALVEQQGKLFAYVKIDDHGYEKRNVTTGLSNGRDVEILSGILPGETVVTEGVIFVRLAETSNVVPEGHSHNH